MNNCLSAWNRNLASLTTARNPEAAKLLKKRAIMGTQEKDIPPRAKWMTPYVNRMRKLYEQLL